jgi:DNA-binding transcriptional LysR family regulator
MSDTQLEDLQSGTLDVGLLMGPFDQPGFECLEVMTEHLVAAIPLGHALATGASSISVKRLASEEMIMFPRAIAPALFDEILGFCRTAGFTLRIAQEARQTQTIISLVSAGLGIAIVPASIRHLKRKGVVYRSFKEETPLVRVIAVWSCDQSSVAIKNFVNMTQIAAAV